MMNFSIVITDTPTRDNKNRRKTMPWGQIKQWAKGEIKTAFGLTNPQTAQIHVTRRECNLITGQSVIKGWTNTATVGNIIDGQTI